MGRGLPCPLAPGEPLHDDLPLDMVARLGWLTGVSGRQLSRPRSGQVSTATVDVGEEGEDTGSWHLSPEAGKTPLMLSNPGPSLSCATKNDQDVSKLCAVTPGL